MCFITVCVWVACVFLLSGSILGTLSKTSFLVLYFQECGVFDSGARSSAGYWSEIRESTVCE